MYVPIGLVNDDRPLRLRVQEVLLELIVKRYLEPGSHLAEVPLARGLGVSRVPIREALLALAHDGWVDQHKSRGSFVHIPTRREVEDTFGLRTVLEAESAALAAEVITDEEVSDLRAIIRQGFHALDLENHTLAVDLNGLFHSQICSIAGNTALSRVYADISKRINWYFGAVVRNRNYSSWEEHTEIVDALEKHENETAYALAAAHAKRTWKTYLSVVGDANEVRDGGLVV